MLEPDDTFFQRIIADITDLLAEKMTCMIKQCSRFSVVTLHALHEFWKLKKRTILDEQIKAFCGANTLRWTFQKWPARTEIVVANGCTVIEGIIMQAVITIVFVAPQRTCMSGMLSNIWWFFAIWTAVQQTVHTNIRNKFSESDGLQLLHGLIN